MVYFSRSSATSKKNPVNLKRSCESSLENSGDIVENSARVSFSAKFMCLRSDIYFLMGYSEGANNRANKGSKHMGTFKFIWDDCSVPIETKIKLLSTIPLNLLLWGGDNWSGNKEEIRKLKCSKAKL